MRDWFWDTWDYLAQGGWVMVPIAASSLLMWVFILERWSVYARLGGPDIEPAEGLRVVGGGEAPDEGGGLRRRLERGLTPIGVLAAVAPLLGLLGTVLGMIQTFDVIAFFGTGNARALAGGISVALITTQTGLLVAIPGLIMANRLARRAEALRTGLDEAAAALARHLGGAGRRAA